MPPSKARHSRCQNAYVDTMASPCDPQIPPDILPLKVRPLQHQDHRDDEEIIQTLFDPPPVVSEKNVWAFWDKGFAAMPPWQKRNVIAWVRMLGPSWTVRLLDLDQSTKAGIFNFVDQAHLPLHIIEGKATGKFSGAHTSDAIRLPLIYQYGGVWMDVGLLLLMHLDQVCWDVLGNPKTKFEVALASADPTLKSGAAENFFIAGRKGNGFIKRWMLVQLEAWKGRHNSHGIHADPLFHHLIRDGNLTHVFKGASEDKLDYFQAYLAYERLRLLEDPKDGFNGPSYCKNRILLIDYKEFALAAMKTNDNGPEQFKMFKTRHDDESEGLTKTREFFTDLLSDAGLLKLYHWHEGDIPTLVDLWDKPENHDADCLPGTFGEYLRFVSQNFTQDRKIRTCKFPPIREKILVAGLLETFDE